MKTLQVLLLLLLLPYLHFGQNCGANAGGTQSICQGDQMILRGDTPSGMYETPVVSNWTAVSGNPINVVISNPTALVSGVQPASPNTEFLNGVYTFELCVLCEDGEYACMMTTITVGEIVTPPLIQSHPSEICGSSFTFVGSTPDPGVISQWLIQPDEGVTFTSNGNNFTVEHTDNFICTYEIVYIQEIGGCSESVSTQITFNEEFPNLSASVSDPGCPSCSRTLRLCGDDFGCGGTPQWSVVSTPSGVNLNSVIFSNPENACIDATVPVDGDYTFAYTIENGACATSTATVSCSVQEQTGFEIGDGAFFVSCGDVWDIPSLDIAVNNMAGVNYEWTLNSTFGTDWITISDPNAAEITLTFSGLPVAVPAEGMFITATVLSSYMNCEDQATYSYYVSPNIQVNAENVSLLCGGDPSFEIRDYLTVGVFPPLMLAAEVISSPSSEYPPGFSANLYFDDGFNLVESGVYTFNISASYFGNDPVTGAFNECTSNTILTVLVANVPTISAGSDIVIQCVDNTQLNGNPPLDSDGNLVDIPVLWTQVGGPSGALIMDPDDENPFVSNLIAGEVYTFRYIFSQVPGCELTDDMMVTVEPDDGCPDCELELTIVKECSEGCTVLEVSGADTYLWSPTTGVDNPNSSTPTICNAAGGVYIVYGYVDGILCGSEVINLDPCRGGPVDCGFYADTYCIRCGCGKLNGGMTIYDSDGNVVDPTIVSITWTVGGVNYDTYSNNPFDLHYEGVQTYTAHIEYTSDAGVVCDTTISREVVCEDDCANFQVASCSSPLLQGEYDECGETSGDDFCAEFSGGGYLFVTDATGNPVSEMDYNFDWFNDGWGETNPYYINYWEYQGCGPIPVRIWSFSGCDTIVNYYLDCCATVAPEVDCLGEGLQITWPSVCGTSHYEVQIDCFSGFGFFPEPYIVDEPNDNGQYVFTIPPLDKCDIATVQVRGFCSSSESYGPWSDCVMVSPIYGCIPTDGSCQDLFGTGGEGRSGNPFLSIAPLADDVQLYPNPVGQDEVYVQLGDDLIKGGSAGTQLRLMDINGRLLLEKTLREALDTYILSVEKLPVGIYYLGIYSPEGHLLKAKRLIRSME